MPYTTKLISQTLFNKALSELEVLGKYGKLSTRLQLIIISKNTNISTASKALNFSRASIVKWIKRFDKDGISGLIDKKGRGRKLLANVEILSRLKELIKADSTITIKKMRLEINNKFHLNISKSTIHNYIKSLGYSNITGRPMHYKQEQSKLEDFKKNSNRIKRKKSK